MPIELVIADPRSGARDALKTIVQGWGWTVTGEARDALEAVRIARELEPDVLIIDAVAGQPDIDEILTRGPSGARPLVVRLLDSPQEHAAGGGIAVLKGVPSDSLRGTIEAALTERQGIPAGARALTTP